MKTLIVGADSLLGNAVIKNLKEGSTLGTSRKKENISKSVFYFDLGVPEEHWPNFPDNINCAFIAAAISKQSQYTQNPKYAKHINIHQTGKLIKLLTTRGIHVVFPSTNIVLECTKPMQTIEETPSPQGPYAKGKAHIEETFKNNEQISIARLPKILDSKTGILQEWITHLLANKPINAFKDLYISPVSLDYAAKFIISLLKNKKRGIWHLSGNSELSYYDLACALCDKLGTSRQLIKAEQMEQQEKFALPLHPSLDCSKTHKELGIRAQRVEDMIEDLLTT